MLPLQGTSTPSNRVWKIILLFSGGGRRGQKKRRRPREDQKTSKTPRGPEKLLEATTSLLGDESAKEPKVLM